MKTLIILLITTMGAIAEDTYFSAVSQNVDTGDTVYTSGYTERPSSPYAPQIEFLQRDTERLRAANRAMEVNDIANQQLSELMEQTTLLRKIAEKQ
jgi:hypothetical protein